MEVVANTLILLGGVILLFGAAGVIIGLILRSRRRRLRVRRREVQAAAPGVRALGTLAGLRSLAVKANSAAFPSRANSAESRCCKPMDLARPLERRDHSAARGSSSRTRESQGDGGRVGEITQLERSVQRKC